jgi:hypothetical protein
MRKIFNLIFLVTGITAFFAACDKANDIPFYGAGKGITLTSSATDLTPPASDSNNVVLTLSWTYPDYANDSSTTKYTIEIDSAGKNFAKAATKIVSGSLNTAVLAKELTNILLAKG